MHTEYVSSQLLFVNTVKFVVDVFTESVFTWNHLHNSSSSFMYLPQYNKLVSFGNIIDFNKVDTLHISL